MNFAVILLLSIQFVISTASGVTSTQTSYWSNDYITTYSTSEYAHGGFLGIDVTTDITYYVEYPSASMPTVTVENPWTGADLTTYSTLNKVRTDADGSTFTQTVFYVYTTRNHGITVTDAWTGTYTSFYKTGFTTFGGFIGIGATTSTLYYVETPIRDSTLRRIVKWDSAATSTYSTVISTTTDDSGNETTGTTYLIGVPSNLSTSFTTEKGTGSKTITYQTVTDIVTDNEGFESTEIIYYIQTPVFVSFSSSKDSSISETKSIEMPSTESTSAQQSVNQSTSHSIDQSTSHSLNQSTSQSVDQSTFQSVNQSTSHSVDQSTSQAIDGKYVYTTTTEMGAFTFTTLAMTVSETITGTDGIATTFVTYYVETPAKHITSTSFKTGTDLKTSTYSTVQKRVTDAEGNVNMETIYYVDLPIISIPDSITTSMMYKGRMMMEIIAYHAKFDAHSIPYVETTSYLVESANITTTVGSTVTNTVTIFTDC